MVNILEDNGLKPDIAPELSGLPKNGSFQAGQRFAGV